MTVTGLFTWLGGGQPNDVAYRHERTGYALTGAAVLLFAIVSALVTAFAVGSVGTWPVLGVCAAALLVGILACAIARALATRRPDRMPDKLGLLARIGLAVLTGGLIAELAAIVVFGDSVDRTLDERAQRDTATAPQVVAARAEVDRARAERVALDRSITKAQQDIDRALEIARCELSPSPECPQTLITRVPGRGPEAQVANDMLDDTRKQLVIAQARVEPADRRLADAEKAVSTAESAAFAAADRGLGARWQAMNEYTTQHAGAMPLRILTILAVLALALLPLLLRWWRGDTSFDRATAALAVRDKAEQDAEAAIAVKQAEVRAEAERLRAEQQLTSARLAVEADTAIDREHQRTRIIAAIGGVELGITEPPRRAELPAAPADERKDSAVSAEGFVTPNLPAPVAAGALAPHRAQPPAAPKAGGGLELPLIGTVPFTDTAARLIRPLVPAFVATAIDNATHPLRTAKQAFEEVEEITFTLRRTRKVTVDTQDSHGSSGYQLAPGAPDAAHARRVAATVVDADYRQDDPRYSALPAHSGTQPYGLPPHQQDELTGRGTRELPGHGRRELPRGH
ncbi:DUF4407 domain-containing protein [Nocardia brasiliensis]|uniref:DUF4407 domain-containing protein n=1 Tax=Nocardia brasiliensis TaxID=37326 RepID=A0A6G9XJD2_NOCBR|nr:DUF4407 domain-containing protein [Nocardia brasiliensis]QIS01026.1 DUF4407 domain-containing protein [Nocardia brasiliensis]